MPASNAIIVGTGLSPHTTTIIDEGLRLARALHGHLYAGARGGTHRGSQRGRR